MPSPTSDSNPTQEQIARRAYEIFEQRGRPEGRDLEHWLEAEAQLRTGRGQSAEPSAGPAKAPRRNPARQAAGAQA